jgi:UDPglucose--hexose-1-phosphate uridylyltransferase
MDRTYHPPAGYCPICPTAPGAFETEIPAPDFDIVVFENRFPSLFDPALEPAIAGTEISPVAPSHGRCEVVVYTPTHAGSFGDLPAEQIYKLTLVWQDRFRELGRLDFIDYVFIFENRGREVGVTLDHPHGQIYAFPYVPPVPARELEMAAQYHRETGACLQCALLAEELADGRRLIWESEHFAAYIPFAARYPYEVTLVPRVCRASLLEMGRAELWSLGAGLKAITQGYDRLFGLPLPYMMMFHQAPTSAGEWPGAHFHVEFHPLQRSKDKLKYRASVESGAGSFINDSLPEDKAAELRGVMEEAL